MNRPSVPVARAVGALLLLALVAGCTAPRRDRFPPRPDAADNHTIWVVDHGWHTGIVVARNALALPALDGAFADARYIEFGWGDIGFYMAPEDANLTWRALQALFASRGTVVHVAGLSHAPREHFPRARIEELVVSDAGFRAMRARIEASFRREADGRLLPLGRGLYADSRFYRALGTYWAAYTCNNWTAEMLRETGCPITPLYAITSGNVMYQARTYCQPA